MNNERFRARARLLNDVLAEESVREKMIAMGAFRRARFRRSVRAFSGFALLFAAALMAGVHYSRIEPTTRANTSQPQPFPTVADNSSALLKLTDEQLLGSFPSNACFLAEVNGRQILVFTDQSMKEKFLHKPPDRPVQASH